jgi:lipoprotein-anchoring transpeptidase ErfK/SrfK
MMRRTRMLVTTVVLATAVSLWAVSGAASAEAPHSASLAAGEPAPSPTATPALSLAAAQATVTAGDAVTLTVRLGVAGAPVQLSRRVASASGFVRVSPLVTDEHGVARYRAHPRAATTYRVEFAGDTQWLPASAEVGVSVRPRITLSVAARVYRGERVGLEVSVRPEHPGATVTLQQRENGAWAEWRSLTLGDASRARTTWRPDQVGTRRLRVVMAADADHVEGVSPARRITTVKPNPYGVPAGAKRIVVVDLSQYMMYFFSYGREVRSFPCVLGRPSLPTPRGHFKIYARGMWPGGPYGARIMSYHPPCAIHGTNEPHLLKRFPRDFSHGCTRLSNADAIWLYDHAPIGTPVWNVP